MRTFRIFLALAVVFAFTAPLIAQNNNPCPGDKEYQFNIIGMAKGKKPDLKNNDGHRIFVNLSGSSKIFMTGDTDQDSTNGLQCGTSFGVLDANATGSNNPALILVPCDPLTADNLDPNVCFDVYATPLGTPGGHTNVDVVCSFDNTCLECDIDQGACATGGIDFDLDGHNGKPQKEDITGVFRASGCIDLVGDPLVCEPGDLRFSNEWIFNIAQLEEYYWDYDNQGNRIVNIRFCNVEGVEGACSGGEIVQP